EKILSARGPLIRGAFGTRARVCGKPGCRCLKGDKHVSSYLSASEIGKVRQVHVPVAEEEHVRRGVDRYRSFLSTRADLAELAEQELVLIDELGRLLLEPYPADRPLPPASKMGRRPKPRRGHGGQG
ncbi:MAG: DUF6788 family protein, partial [Planctomycetota bacterium]